MKRELVLATGNEHKKRELSAMIPELRIVTPGDLGLSFDYEETGHTYLANALGKALALHRLLAEASEARPVLADDSGLSVRALDGRPGVHSARYGARENGDLLSAAEKNRLLLEEMREVKDRRAFYVCCMVLLYSEHRYVIAQETWEGEIARAPSTATGGFGYDPIFFLPDENRAVSELTEEEKNARSHRGRALNQILPHIRAL